MNKSLIESLAKLQLANPFAPLTEPLMMLAFALCVLGYILTVLSKTDDNLRAFGRMAVATIFIASIPLWSGIVRSALYYLPEHLLDYHTGMVTVFDQLTGSTNRAVDRVPDYSILDLSSQSLIDTMTVLAMRLLCTIGSFIAAPLLIIQIFLDQVLIVLMPIAISAATIPPLRNQAQGFMAFWISTLLWPLGFAIVTVMAGSVFTLTDRLGNAWVDSAGSNAAITNFFAPAACALILIFGILSVPPLAYSLCTHGGASMLGGAAGTVSSVGGSIGRSFVR
jgi:hypothetical protein